MNLPPTVHLPASYFENRHITIHCDNDKLYIDADTFWGQYIHVITSGHRLDGRETVARPVIVERRVFIGSYALLYNCIIREGAVVGCGSVVRSCEVAPYTVVAGNPARVIARFRDGQWEWVEPKWRVLE
jgi:maltose O-acetyltransferase